MVGFIRRFWCPLASALALLTACGGGADSSVSSTAGSGPGVAVAEAACSAHTGDTGSTRPAGWTDASHGKAALPDYATVFPAARVLRMDITIASCDWQAVLADMATLLGRPLAPTRSTLGVLSGVGCSPSGTTSNGEFFDGTPLWVPGTLRFNGQVWNHVGLRLKGGGTLVRSWNAGLLKLPFRLDFDRFDKTYPSVADQRFWGFEKLSFGNQASDRSFMREKLVSDLLRESGVPVARTVWVQVTLDFGAGPQNLGLYTMSEIPDKPMLQAQFGNKNGNLYKPQGTGAAWEPLAATTPAVFEKTFEKENNTGAADWSDVRNAIDALHAGTRITDPAGWRANLEQRLNVPRFLRWMSANAVLGHGDTYGHIAHNYYLYADASDVVPGRLSWIPWDHDLALTCGALDPTYPATGYPANRWPLFRYLLDDTVYRAQYLQLATDFFHGNQFDALNLQSWLDAAYTLIEPFVTGAQGEQLGTPFSTLDTTAQFVDAQAALRSVIAQRRANVPVLLQ